VLGFSQKKKATALDEFKLEGTRELLKYTNGGVTWQIVFDHEMTVSSGRAVRVRRLKLVCLIGGGAVAAPIVYQQQPQNTTVFVAAPPPYFEDDVGQSADLLVKKPSAPAAAAGKYPAPTGGPVLYESVY
jgi:hypothetical protein